MTFLSEIYDFSLTLNPLLKKSLKYSQKIYPSSVFFGTHMPSTFYPKWPCRVHTPVKEL